MQVEAAGQENAYVDTSSYEQLYKLYEDYFKLGIACQAMDHWNDPTAEIGNQEKEELINRMFNSMTFGNELKPAYNFDASSENLFKVDFAHSSISSAAKSTLNKFSDEASKLYAGFNSFPNVMLLNILFISSSFS